jgi:hypothetical protein
MVKPTSNQMQEDLWRFILIGCLMNSIFYVLIKGSVATERLPFRYFLLAAVGSFVVEAVLYFLIRNWPGRRKTWVVWLIGLLWIGVCLFGGKR